MGHAKNDADQTGDHAVEPGSLRGAGPLGSVPRLEGGSEPTTVERGRRAVVAFEAEHGPESDTALAHVDAQWSG